MLRELRGAEATQVDRFLRLRRERKVKEYLTHYGEERKEMWQLEETMRARTADVLAAYADVHKAHAVKFAELPEALKPAVFLLHVKWRDELREKGFKVRLQNAIEVVNKLRAFEQRRLMEAEAYTAISPSTRHEEAGEEADTAEEQVAQ
jgi:CHASE3 domain sensor protein